jgi:hypothetical protein
LPNKSDNVIPESFETLLEVHNPGFRRPAALITKLLQAESHLRLDPSVPMTEKVRPLLGHLANLTKHPEVMDAVISVLLRNGLRASVQEALRGLEFTGKKGALRMVAGLLPLRNELKGKA